MASSHPATRTLFRHRSRVEEIVGVFARYGIAHVTTGTVHERLGQFLPGGIGEPDADASDGRRLREAFSKLGPTFIKIGQVLSTRIDIVGPDIAAELKALQTGGPVDSPEIVRATVEAELGQSLEEAFAEFDQTPIASASIAQAHVARLHDGTEVVVKVRHAGIEEVVAVDFEILEALMAVVEEHDEELALHRPRGIVRQLGRTVRAELDLQREAAALEHGRANFAEESDVDIPRPVPELSARGVLTMSRLRGERLDTLDGDPDLDGEAFALRAARIYIEMILRDRFFHADPHPGNILIDRADGSILYGILDWGEVGVIDRGLEDKLGALILAIAMGDRPDVTDALLDIATAPPGIDIEAFRLDVSDWLDSYGTGGASGIDVAAAISDLARVVRAHRLRMPPDVAMLAKTLIQLQGDLGTAGVDLQIARAFEGYLEEIVKERLSPERFLRRARRTVHDWDRLFQQAPRDLSAILQAVRLGELEVPLRVEGLDRSVNRVVYGILAAALFSGSSNLWARRVPPVTRNGTSIPGAAGTILSAAFAVQVLKAVRRRGGAG
jgi:ubiquinone biosynthesis protein